MAEANFSGEWISTYSYHEGKDASQHTVVFEGDKYLVGRSLGQADGSELLLDLRHGADTNILTGVWMETTSPAGQYRGAVFRGALQLILNGVGDKAEGKWVGHNSDFTKVSTGDWRLEKKLS